ncbi:MAG: EamA family transporter [Clostridia bacterium]|nr:EamA family transporter [Clostridia bacterium]
MPYLFLTVSVFCMASSSVCGGYFNRHTSHLKDQTPLFNFSRSIFTFLCWCLFFLFNFSFDVKVLPYALLMGVGFSITIIANIKALKAGSVALTSLMLQSSLIFVTIWGLIFWGAPLTITTIVGLVLVAVSLSLCVLPPKNKTDKNKTVSLKWVFWATLTLCANAFCTILQREQQTAFDGKHGSLLMVITLFISSVVCGVIFAKSDKSQSLIVFKKEWFFPASAGVMNFLLNLFIILLATSSLSPSVIYPVIAVGGLIVSMLFSLFAFKEKLNWWQWLGFGIGAVAIALINL